MNTSQPAPAAVEAPVEEPACPKCGKPPALCICEAVSPVENRVAVLILQHPQEQDRLLGTARLAATQLSNATFKIGLSWSSLSKALGREAEASEWAILHLGSTKLAELPENREVVTFDKKGILIADQDAALKGIKGIVVFDGTWAQAKTLWWRNAWVLKMRRLVLNPKTRSLYGELRREPKRESLSTIESIGLALSAIERKPALGVALRDSFGTMLETYRTALASGAVVPEKPTKEGGGGKRRGGPRRRGPKPAAKAK